MSSERIFIGKPANPFDSLIEASGHDPEEIQARYETHRTTRNAQQKIKFLSPEFDGVSVDPILLRLEDASIEPGFVDTRNSMNVIVRPPEKVRKLIRKCQDKLQEIIPNLWIAPQTALHMTVLEVAHSRTVEEIALLAEQLSGVAPSIVNHPRTHHTRLVKPLLSFDASALALSFLPCPDAYTYHHLRRDLFSLARTAVVELGGRYVVPSAHVTVGRFIRAEDLRTDERVDPGKVRKLVARIEDINAWLEREFGVEGSEAMEWIVGEETGLEWRTGLVWYGFGGETLAMGEAF
ncbi:RNA ligase/cyclic nucleotide phosphodiesterase [Mycena crocata]|nr:RNA ligase/cyclic nucleotide phosphodiesterase [Mycena crocata]